MNETFQLTYSRRNIIIKRVIFVDLLDQNLTVTRIIAAVQVPGATGEPVHRDRPSHGLVYMYGGHYCYRFDNGTMIDVRGGECIYLPQHSNYDVRMTPDPIDAPQGCYAVNFWLDDDQSYPPFRLPVKNASRMLTLFQGIERMRHRPVPGAHEECMAMLYQIIALLKEARGSYHSGKDYARIAPALSYIAEHLTHEDIPLELLAERCGMSQSYLRKLFSHVYGVPPVVYIRQLRLVYARELLESGEYSVTAAAEAAGFNDISYFSRAFKQHFRLSPTHFARCAHP